MIIYAVDDTDVISNVRFISSVQPFLTRLFTGSFNLCLES